MKLKFRLKDADKKTLILLTASSAAFVLILIVVILLSTIGGGSGGAKEDDETKRLSLISDIKGVWIASISNIDFPSAPNLSEDELKAELDSIVETVSELGLNTIFFQVRPSSDALYDSQVFPVSQYLSENGVLTLDCLDYIIESADKKGIAVHAWINPLRAAVGGNVSDLTADNPARMNPSWCVKYADGKIYYDCGIPEVRDMVADGVREIVENYDVAGVVFDDYFYPYPVADSNNVIATFADSHTYSTYGSSFDDIGDWRRDNVNRLVEQCYKTVKEADYDCYFGVAPFGIWKNGYGDESGSLTRGSQSYFDIYCDTVAWAKGGYVDYVAPQLYWTDDTAAAPYNVLAEWWANTLEETDTAFLVSHAAYRYSEWEKPTGILTSQIKRVKDYNKYSGSMFYGYEEIKNNTAGITDELRRLYAKEKQQKGDS